MTTTTKVPFGDEYHLEARSRCPPEDPLVHQKVRLAVIVPAGPHDEVLDTLESVVHYGNTPRIIVVIDDTADPYLRQRASELSADIVVIPAPANAAGVMGGLWVKLATGYRWILQSYDPDIFLRLDADALMIGYGIEDEAEQTFQRNPNAGLLGSYRIGPSGDRRDFSWAARKLRAEMGFAGLLHPNRRARLRELVARAATNGYTYGESALGGAYIQSRQAVNAIYQLGWFDQPWLAASGLGEDHIMALLTFAAGYRLHDFGGPGDPLALSWRGLSAHPNTLMVDRKRIIHSVRFWQDITEPEIRQIFAAVRAADPSGNCDQR